MMSTTEQRESLQEGLLNPAGTGHGDPTEPTEPQDPNEQLKENAEAEEPSEPTDSGKQEEKPQEKSADTIDAVPFRALYRYATCCEMFWIVISLFCTVLNGALFPAFTLVFGKLLDTFNGGPFDDKQQEEINTLALLFVGIAVGTGILSLIEVALPVIVVENILVRVRKAYVTALLRQDPGWFDTNSGSQAVVQLAESSVAMGNGMSDKFNKLVGSVTTLMAGFGIGFYTSWKLTLVIAGSAPFFGIALGVLIFTSITSEKILTAAYAKAGDAATEAISLIRTVSAFGGETHEMERYESLLATAMRAGVKKGFGLGASVGMMLFTFYAMYGVSTYAGVSFIIDNRLKYPDCAGFKPAEPDKCFTGGQVVQCFIAVLLGATSFGQIGPFISALAAARVAAAKLYAVIDNVPTIDVEQEGGHKPEKIMGKLEFRNVTFAYPSRPDQTILKNFNLTIEAGKSVALAGESGSGKSTLIQLIQRNYDPLEGEVLVDDVNVKQWNLRHLRSKIGLVQQDPLLFGVSIKDNIAMGCPAGCTDAEVVNAAKAANAHTFITALGSSYNTMSGTSVSSTQLSGGQRQRICIARAIVRQPTILLLDEATSALDTESERVVQQSLDNLLASATHTTVTIAHRLSTITGADCIVVMQQGQIVEKGTHVELMQHENGLYKAMRELQEVAGVSAKKEEDQAVTVIRRASSTKQNVVKRKSSIQRKRSLSKSGASGSLYGAEAFLDDEKADDLNDINYDDIADLPDVSRWRLWSLQANNWCLIILGLFGSIASGLIQPAFSLIYSDMILLFFEQDNNKMRQDSYKYIGYFAAIGGGAFVACVMKLGIFTYLGEILTKQLRARTYEAILRQPMKYFDDPKNSVGRLTARLATDAACVKDANSEVLGNTIEGIAAVAFALGIAYYSSWQLASVLLAVFPFLIVGAYIQFNSYGDSTVADTKAVQESGQTVLEAVLAIKTVMAFSLQAQTIAAFSANLTSKKVACKKAMIKGVGTGFQKFALMAAYGLAFWSGGVFLKKGIITDFNQILRCFLAITLSADAVGRISSQAPDAARANRAARQIFAVIDAPTPIDPLQTDGKKGTGSSLKIEFKKVSFNYPSRPEVPVLRELDLVIEPGQTVALVGASGSGKSTIIQLLQRCYDIDEGEILLDGVAIKEYNVPWLRAQFGLVQQEPVLFADNIAYNIEYGRPGKIKGVPNAGSEIGQSTAVKIKSPAAPGLINRSFDAGAPSQLGPEDVVEAARQANALDFIMTLGQKFGTFCGARGAQLSGGQKQRVAIARALIRDPKMLLLDEATSALDNKSEAVVQAALDQITSGENKRSSLIIAHRLSSIVNSDKIVVMEKGKVIEGGTHQELVALKGGYFSLAKAQNQA